MIKVTLGEKPKEEKPFPKLMIIKHGESFTGRVVLFHSEKKGTVISTSKNDYLEVGDYNDCWIMSAFEYYNEPVTLQNA